jgi:hypothetical protein
LDRKTIQALFVMVCRDSGFTLDPVNAAQFVALLANIHPLQVWLAMPSWDVMGEIAAGRHPSATSRKVKVGS